jgi:DNA-binding MarR family transcriptional regulator
VTEDQPLPALLRAARRSYGRATRAALEDELFDDLPINGPYVLAGAAGGEVPLSRIIQLLGLSKQATGHLVDTLVTRGYVERSVDPADRRRLTLALTERGIAAAAVVREAVARVDEALVEQVGVEEVARTKATLAALAALHQEEDR